MQTISLSMRRTLCAALLALLLSVIGITKGYASYNFSAVCSTGQTLYYKITNTTNRYVELTYPGSYYWNGWSGYNKPTGNLILPGTVQYNGRTYTVTSIGAHTFDDCYDLTSVEISNSVTSINEEAFYFCGGLTSVIVGSSVATIGNYAFSGCSNLDQIMVASNNTHYDSRGNCNAIIETNTNTLVLGCKNTVIPNSVTSIGNNAFYSCYGLSSIEIPNSVTSIGSNAFSGCYELTSIEFPNSIISIGDGAFTFCDSLTSIEIPNSVVTIGEMAFSSCGSLEEIVVASDNVYYDSRENCNAIIETSTNTLVAGCKNTVIPNSVSAIGIGAFNDCRNLISIEIPNSVTSIGDMAFGYCFSLTSVEFSNSLTSIGYYAFDGCSSLTSIELPNSLISIGDGAFEGCSGMNSITIGNSVDSIGWYAFGYCSGLASITVLAETPPILGNNVFYGIHTIPVYVPCSALGNYLSASDWSSYTNINIMGLCSGEVAVTVNPIEGGMVTGAGTFMGGEVCTLTAIPNEGYPFCSWTENDIVVSYNSTYTFVVTGDRNLVASFGDCPEIAIGIDSTATDPYLPSYTSYNYNLSQQIYLADEIGKSGLINSVAFYNAGSTNTREFDIYLVSTDKTSFERTTDWIAATESDLVFSGSVTLEADKWTFISFETPFAYDTTSNLALIIDDNTGAYSYSNTACRVFSTNVCQAIRNFSGSNNHDPNNPTQYYGSLQTIKNQIVLGFLDSNYRYISVSANSHEAGTIEGGGIYSLGDICTLTATANNLYEFVNWTKDGIIVSNNPIYSFTVTENANYTANFEWSNLASVDYVSDGLIMYLDGICNTRNGHATTATIWEDLMGNYDLTVSNYSSYTWKDNHFLGLGNGGYLNTGKTWRYFNSLNDDLTIEIVTYIDCDKTSPAYRGLAGWHSGSDGTNFQNDQGSGRMQTLGQLPVSDADNTISTVTYTRTNGSFLNGNWKTNNTNMLNGVNSDKIVVFGNSIQSTRGWNDSIYCIRMYNRSLTQEEIAYNHNIDVERFGASSSSWFGIVATANPTNGGTVSGTGTYELGQVCTLTATANPNYTFINWTENGSQVSVDPIYGFEVTGYRSLVANFIQNQPNTYIVSATVQPVDGGSVRGGGGYAAGSICTLRATPAQGYFFHNWTHNGNVVSTSPTFSFTVTGNANYTANFTLDLPELHVTSITHSEFIAGQQATISWTVQNDGTAATPNGEIWHDRVWLSVESRVAAGDNNPILLGTFDNLSALDVGEYYTQTQTFDIPIDIVGEYYLFVLTDAYDAYLIFWENNQVPIPYNPPPYIGCLSHHCPNCINVADNRIYELSESEHGLYNDNFFYTLVDIAVPSVPDLQVTSIVPPGNFFSGTDVNVIATIGNLGDITTLSSSWTDALYVSNEPDFSSATCIATASHLGTLPVGDSYQVTFTGRVPITMYGEAYFFVQTDCYEQVYEHVWNHNNVAMSEAVNIILTPPADLEPADIVVPTSISTGESFTYSFKVFNVGAGNPNVNTWKDKVYLSQNAESIEENAILMNTQQHNGGLQPGVNYSVSETIYLPAGVASGTYYLYVIADANDEVFEYLYDDNNTAYSSQIVITAPDLQVIQISAPEQIMAGYPLNLSYTVTNEGDGAVDNRMVTDKVYIFLSGNISDTIGIANIRRNAYHLPGQSLTVMCNDLAPYSLTNGTYHLIVITDCDNEINESNERNNSYTHYPIAVFHQPLPDLQSVSLTIPSVIQAGETIPVEFDVTNIGDLDLLNSNCTCDVYALMGEEEILCPVQSQTLPLGNNVSIGIGQTVHFVRSILVPPIVTSACSTFELIVNKGSLVPELDTTNNIFTTSALVLDCPLPDLVAANIAATSVQAGVENQISFAVNNIGTADFEGQFNTTVYVRSANDTVLCPLVLQVGPMVNSYSISVGGTLEFTQNVLIPPMANASCSILEVMVDEENLVLEADDNNNATTLDASVVNYPFDLKTMTLQVQGSVWAGETTSLTWSVKNIGTCPSETIPLYVMRNGTYTLVQGEILPQPWMDKVYISTDAVLSDDDTELCSVARSTVLYPNGMYTVEQSVTLPYTNLGAQYLLCLSDATRVTYDSDILNNVMAVPIEVQLGSLPDLRITSLAVEDEMTSDRAYWVHYTVVNEGERVTQRDSWVDAFYIGEAMTTIGALQLGSKLHHGALEVGENYTDSIEIIIPNSMVGDYFLMGYTDKTNQIYEHENEDDNLLAIPVAVWAPDPCDLIAIQPEFPVSVVSGEDMTVSWQLRNIGANPAVGRVRNAVYLSADDTWSSDDRMLGYADININIAGSEQHACSLSGTLTGVAEGNYYVIVKANILNALNESNYENNACVSLLTTKVDFPLLVIGEDVDRTMNADQYIYYKIEVGPEFEGQTLSCRLTTTEQQVANGIYLSHGEVPTLSQFDYGQYMPYSQELELLIPALEQGNYYLLAKGTSQSGSPQQINIATSIINFEILSVDADHGSNTGSITTKVIGAKFDSIMDFRLVQGGEYLPAEKIFFSNSTQTFTTFNLADMPSGTYAMEAELPGGIITIKDGAFTIEEGLPAELAVNIVAPASVRNGNTFAVNIEYGNIGTTDLNVSGFVVISRNGHPLSFTTEGLDERLTELTFDAGETNGNPDVMRPGYRGTKAILVKATPSTDISLAVYAIRRQY